MSRTYFTRKGTRLYTIKSYFMQRLLPYGVGYCADGREVLFDRDYAPICQRYPGEPATMVGPAERVHWQSQDWFYDDRTRDATKRRRGREVLAEWGMTEPALAQAEQLARVREDGVGNPKIPALLRARGTAGMSDTIISFNPRRTTA
jgi:hypothetical protein